VLKVTATLQQPGASPLAATAQFADLLPIATSADLVTVSASVPVVAMLDACQVSGASVTPVHALMYLFLRQKQLPENLTQAACPRPAEYAVLSPNHRMIFRDLTGTTIWTNQPKDELKLTASSDWKAADLVYLYLHYFVDEVDPKPLALAMVNAANAILLSNRLGIVFQAVQPMTAGTPQEGKCDPSHLQNVLGILPGEVRLHVVFVKDINDGASADGNGKACPKSATGAGRVILIDWKHVANSELLAHELGHVLGHERPALGFDHVVQPGSSGGTPGFSKTNVMHENEPDVSRTVLTTGQIFRMNVDQNSWYQTEPGIFPRHPKKPCGCEPYKTEICPRLDRQPGVTPVTAPLNYCPGSG
jgi:hypothetical protein